MNTPSLSRRQQQGSVLLICLVIAAIAGITLASYLVMTQAQHQSVVRSQTWNFSMTLTEAGVEDGLAMINKFSGDFESLHLWTNATSLANDNWGTLGNNIYYARRYVSVNGWGTNYYDVYITNTAAGPILTSVGVAAWSSALASPQTYFATVGTDSRPATPIAKRKISVRTAWDPLFAVAMAAVSTINLNGNNIATDSFDSSDPNHSIDGLYPFAQPSMVKSNGDVCTTATIIDSISVGNAEINGVAKTGPLGSVAVGPNGYVTGGIDDDFNVKFPTVKLPSGSWYSVPSISLTIDGTSYNRAILSDGSYWLHGLTDQSLYIGTNVNCRIYITSYVNLAGTKQIRIGKGSKVTVYMAASTFKISGNGVVNDNGNADSFTYYGLPGNTTIDFGGNGSFTGTIYAPQADFSLGGGGNDTKDFIGASVTKSVKMNGHFRFHYDEALRMTGPGRGYVPVDWSEIAAR